jgi:hypothetical protein
MAMSSWLQAVTDEEIAGLRSDPSSINGLDKPLYYRTHFFDSISYFVTGEVNPSGNHPLGAILQGEESVACATLENGWFHLLSPRAADQLVQRLADLDLDRVRDDIAHADLDDLIDEEEVYDLELLGEGEAPGTIVEELEGMIAFYTRVAAEKLGVVIYTT